MNIFYDLKEKKKKTCIALGFFGGIHLGHIKVINEMLKYAKENSLASCLLTFKSAPKYVLKKTSDKAEKYILQESEKIRILENLGVENLYIIDFESILNLSADDFIEKVLIDKFNAKHIFCGFNYHFGKGGKSTAEDLSEKCKKYGVKVTIIAPEKLNKETVSSSLIKKLLATGKIEKVNSLLGRCYSYDLPVIKGEKIGSKILLPTINQKFPENFFVPKFGVYKSKVSINGKDFNELVLTAFYDYMDDLKKFNAYAAGGKGTKILTTDSFKEAVTAAYEGFGWVTDEDGNEIDIYDEDGNALYPECIKEDER